MYRKSLLTLLPVSLALLAADGQSWKDKPIAEWNDQDSKQVLTESPWAKSIQPTLDPSAGNGQRQRGMGRGGGIGIGLPGMGGMGRHGGMGNSGGANPGSSADSGQTPALQLRWESALPVRAAVLKAHDSKAPTIDEGYYAIVVYGVPDRMITGNPDDLAHQLQKQAAIKRDGKKDLKPSSVEVSRLETGPAIVYLFPRSNEITRSDRIIEFEAKILRLQFTQAFDVNEMTYQGKLEL